MAKTAPTTRFLLGRRGRNLYPLRSHQTLPSLFDNNLPTNSSAKSNQSPTTGRHGVPPSKQQGGWRCSKKEQQVYYAYGFPIPPTPANAKSWINSPVVLITLLLLSCCFVGAYCLVLRIDKTLNETLQQQGASSSSSLYPTAGLRGATRTAHQERDQSLPLFLNLTIYHLPCDELTVQVTQSNHSSAIYETKSDQLIFKNVPLDSARDTTINFLSTSTTRSLAENKDRTLSQPNITDLRELREKDTPDRRLQEYGNGRVSEGCQVMGNLQLPFGRNKQPAIVSFTAKKHAVDMSHRVDLIKLGAVESFPKEESMFLNTFQPHVYTQHMQGDHVVMVHRYNVHDNFHFVEQEESTHDGEAPEIRLVFTPTFVQRGGRLQ